MNPVRVMISSTITDLEGDRDAVEKVFRAYDFVEVVGAGQQQKTAVAGNSYLTTIGMAKSCDLYIIIMNFKYGYEIREDLSATQAEFKAAYRHDPTKILVFVKDNETYEEKQQKFIDEATDYYKGYFRIKYKHTHDLQEAIRNSFIQWLTRRASIGNELNYFDHFIREAIQRKPRPDAQLYYSTSEDQIEFRYEIGKKTHEIHFSREQIIKDFWGCVSSIEHAFMDWENQ